MASQSARAASTTKAPVTTAAKKQAPTKTAVSKPKPTAKKAAPAAARKAVKAAKAPVKAQVTARPAVPEDKPVKLKHKLVRDSFTMPEQEYAVLGQVKKACLKAGFDIKKSELLRIGVALISQLDMATLQQVLASLPQLKTGRPKND